VNRRRPALLDSDTRSMEPRLRRTQSRTIQVSRPSPVYLTGNVHLHMHLHRHRPQEACGLRFLRQPIEQCPLPRHAVTSTLKPTASSLEGDACEMTVRRHDFTSPTVAVLLTETFAERNACSDGASVPVA